MWNPNLAGVTLSAKHLLFFFFEKEQFRQLTSTFRLLKGQFAMKNLVCFNSMAFYRRPTVCKALLGAAGDLVKIPGIQ